MNNNLLPESLEVFEPSTQEFIKSIPATSPEEFLVKIKNAKKKKEYWNNSKPRYRKIILKKFRKAIIKRLEDFIVIIAKETGKKKFESLIELYGAVEHLKNTETLINSMFRKKRRNVGTLITKKAWTKLEPIGMAGIISPWNYPLLLTITSVVEAIAAGNVVILKPSEYTPLTTELLKEVWDQSTGEEDVFQVIYGGSDLGSKLVNSNHVDIICFTGSTKIGKIIARDCAKYLKPVILELGGKDPMIICDDTDLNRAVNAALWGGMTNAGQTCISVERIYVDERIKDIFIEKISKKVKQLTAGKSTNCDIGSITTKNGLEKIINQVNKVKNTSDIYQGIADDKKGYFYPPTIVVDPNDDSDLMKDETFGPVVSISSFRTIEEVIKKANSVGYGLSASIFTKNKKKATIIAKQLKVGSIAINDVLSHYGIADLPFGGTGLSGFGRVHGKEGIKSFCNLKSYMTNRLQIGDEIWWYSKSKRYYNIIIRFLKFYFG